MITQENVYLDSERKLSQSHKLAIQLIQKQFAAESPISVLEVGVGSGAMAKGLRDVFPYLTVDAVDKVDVYLDTSKNYYDNLFPAYLIPKQLRNKLIKKLADWKPSIFAVQFVSIAKQSLIQ